MYISLMNNHIEEHPFTCLQAICLFSSVKHLFMSFAAFCWIFLFFLSVLLRYDLDVAPSEFKVYRLTCTVKSLPQ